MEKIDNPYLKVKKFHEVFDPRDENSRIQELDWNHAKNRSGFMVEELVEFLYAASNNDLFIFEETTNYLKSSIDQAVKKIKNKDDNEVKDPLIEEVDALLDLLYFTYGSFVCLGVDPYEIFEYVHQANMAKLFPDGQPRYDKNTGKVLKPDNWQENFAPELKIAKFLKKLKDE